MLCFKIHSSCERNAVVVNVVVKEVVVVALVVAVVVVVRLVVAVAVAVVVVVREVVCVEVALVDVVCVVVGVVMWHFVNVPLTRASIIWFSVSAVLLQPVVSTNTNPKAQPMSSTLA